MSPTERALIARLRRRAASIGPELARRELEAYELIRRSLSQRELVQAIRSGQVEALIAEMLSGRNVDPALTSLRVAIQRAVIESATSEAANLPRGLRAAFDVLSPRVIQAARALEIQATGALEAEMRESVRQTVMAGLEAGKGPRTIANRILTEAIGLAPSQERAVRSFRAQLEAGDRSALSRALRRGVLENPDGKKISRSGHAGGFGVSARDIAMLERKLGTEQLKPYQIERMVDAYRKRLQAWNTESHARTLALRAQKQAQRLAWEDAIDRGVVSRDALSRKWLTVRDSRVRDSHEEMHGEVVGFDQPFSNGQLEPGENEYNCRCVARIYVVASRMAA